MVDTDTTVGAARETVAHVKDEAAQQGAQVKESVATHAGQMAEEAKAQARTVLDEARSELGREVDEQGRRVGQTLHQVGDQLRSMAGAAEPGLLTDVTRQLADAADRTGGRLEQGGLQSVADDLRSLARRQPGLFLLGAGLAGFFAARLLRAGVSQASTSSASAPGSFRQEAMTTPPATPALPTGGSTLPTGSPSGIPRS